VGDVAVLLALRHPVARDVDRSKFLVVSESDRAVLRCAVALNGGEPAEIGPPQVFDFVRFKRHTRQRAKANSRLRFLMEIS